MYIFAMLYKKSYNPLGNHNRENNFVFWPPPVHKGIIFKMFEYALKDKHKRRYIF